MTPSSPNQQQQTQQQPQTQRTLRRQQMQKQRRNRNKSNHSINKTKDNPNVMAAEAAKLIPDVQHRHVSFTQWPKLMAIYFPQYHPDPLNDMNWGPNFTDWKSLQTSPEMNRLGHRIPRPLSPEQGGLGYYDLRQVATRQRQGELARAHGVDGFIYHHYWFYDPKKPHVESESPTLSQPLLLMLQDGHPNIPFFFNWCAVQWVNVWMGKPLFQTIPTSKRYAIVLQEQYFNTTDDAIRRHYQWLSPFFHHANYIRIRNQPVFMLYSYDPRAIPILERLRYWATQDGWDGLYLIVGRSAAPDHIFVPDYPNLTERTIDIMNKKSQSLETFNMTAFNQSLTYPYPLEWITRPYQVPDWCWAEQQQQQQHHASSSWHSLTSAERIQSRPESLGILTSFDNTPRRDFQHSVIYNGGAKEPEAVLQRLEDNLRAVLYYKMCCQQQRQQQAITNYDDNNDNKKDDDIGMDDQFVAINAWNEWAEGMALEPSDVYGHGFLERIHKVKQELARDGCRHAAAGWKNTTCFQSSRFTMENVPTLLGHGPWTTKKARIPLSNAVIEHHTML
ncbi:hypothetical protein ACA910_019379 [Epithemia clementina (nom. ined.)]